MFKNTFLSCLVILGSACIPVVEAYGAITVQQQVWDNRYQGNDEMGHVATATAEYTDAFYYSHLGARVATRFSHCYTTPTAPSDRVEGPISASTGGFAIDPQVSTICGCPGWAHTSLGESSGKWKATGAWIFPLDNEYDSDIEYQTY